MMGQDTSGDLDIRAIRNRINMLKLILIIFALTAASYSADVEADFIASYKAAIESKKDAEILRLFPAGEYPKGAQQKYFSDYTTLFREMEVFKQKVSNFRIETPNKELLLALQLPTRCDDGNWYGIVKHSNRVIKFDRIRPDGKKSVSVKLLIFKENKYWLAEPEVVPR